MHSFGNLSVLQNGKHAEFSSERNIKKNAEFYSEPFRKREKHSDFGILFQTLPWKLYGKQPKIWQYFLFEVLFPPWSCIDWWGEGVEERHYIEKLLMGKIVFF
jgi:hypothetical protein